MSVLPSLPILIPLAAGIVLVAAGSAPARAHRIALAAALLHLAASGVLFATVHREGILVLQMGGWPAPFGITLVADLFAAVMVLTASVVQAAAGAYSRADISEPLSGRGYHALTQFLVAGVCGAFLTGDIFNLYVWFEVMLISSFGLLVIGGEREQLDGAVKYVVLNLFSTLLFLGGIGLLYGLTGTLNMADLHGKVGHISSVPVKTAVAMIFMAAFGIKSALFPMFFWLPASYHTPSVSVTALFSGLLTKVGVAALIRTFTLVFPLDGGYLSGVLLVVAVLTMVTGVLGAAARFDFRRILTFHIVSQVGYMVLGLALYTPLALAGAMFTVVHNMVVKTGLLLVSGIVQRTQGSFELSQLGGLYRSRPLVAVLFLVPAFSLAGFPPLSGFWGKLMLIRAGLEVDQIAAAVIAAAVGLLTLYSMTKIWTEAFWKPAPERAPGPGGGAEPTSAWLVVPAALLALLSVLIGVGAQPVAAVALQAAETLLHPEPYIQAVLGAR